MLAPTHVRTHLRIEEGTEEDTWLLPILTDAAWEYVRNFTRRDFNVTVEAPKSVDAAVLLVIADLYENREAQSMAPLYQNKTVERLLWPYRAF